MTGGRVSRIGIGTLLALAALPTPAMAQSGVAFGVGGVFNGATPAGNTDANLIDPSGGLLTLFRTTNRIAPAWGVEGLVSKGLGEKWRLELAAGWAATDFETRIADDFEGASGLSVTQRVNQYTGELGLVYRVVERGSFDVFLRGAGGGFREITSDRALVDNGWRASVGGGAHIRLSQGAGWLGRFALRADVRLQARGGGIAFGDSKTRLSPSAFAGFVIGQ